MNYINVRRKAFLIGVPEVEGGDFLHGVSADLKNVRNYLQSMQGGNWYDDEIIILSNPSYRKVREVVCLSKSDYNLTYFSGHGFSSSDKRRMLCFNGFQLPDYALFSYSIRQLVIIDACRTYIYPGLTGIPKEEEQLFYLGGSPSRILLNNCIANSYPGKMIIHATLDGKPSNEDGNGGYFTQALLYVSKRIKADNSYVPASIDRFLQYIPERIQEKKHKIQIPAIAYREGNLTVPFAIGIPSKYKLTSIMS